MDVFVHAHAIVETSNIGRGTRISAFSHVLAGAVLGEDCTIGDHVFVDNGVTVGNRVTIENGAQLWGRVTLEDNVLVGPNVVFTKDSLPHGVRQPEDPPKTVVRQCVSIGANATILPGTEIGRNATVGAGAVIRRAVPSNTIVTGSPASISGYLQTERETACVVTAKPDASTRITDLPVARARLYHLPIFNDLRGSLTFAQCGDLLPFQPKRFFVVFDVPSKEIRGAHAHIEQHEFLVCVRGSLSVILDDSENRTELTLDEPNIGLYIPPMIWSIEYKQSADAVLVALMSDVYKPEDYIRDYEEYLRRVKRK